MGDVLFLVLRRLRAPLIVLIVAYAVSIAGLVAIPGLDAQGRPTRMGLFHAFYVMSYTATTIGFGELPHPFTDAQRIWVVVSIYLSVIGWAYALGTVFALSQDAAFRSAASRVLFARRVARLSGPYCVVCGYGRSGREIARALDAMGVRLVIVDIDVARVAPIEIEPFDAEPLVLVADARRPSVLRDAGIATPACRAVLALTGDDEANQSIAIGARVLDPSTRVVARVVDPVVHANLEAYGGVRVVNPFATFATNLGLGFAAPEVLRLEEWLTGAPGAARPEPPTLPPGHWVLAGYGRFGRPVAAALGAAGQTWQAFDPAFRPPDEAADRVSACVATEDGLRQGGIERAAGVVAGTDNDTQNLAVVAMARRARPGIAVVMRRNKVHNQALIDAARPVATFVQSEVMVHEVLQALTTPLLERLLALARVEGSPVARLACERLREAFGDRVPFVWTVGIDAASPGLAPAFAAGRPPTVGELCRDPRDPALAAGVVALLLSHAGAPRPGDAGASGGATGTGGARSADARWRRRSRPRAALPVIAAERASTDGRDVALPDDGVALAHGDCLMFAGPAGAEALQRRFLLDPGPLEHARTGREPARGALFRALERRRARRATGAG